MSGVNYLSYIVSATIAHSFTSLPNLEILPHKHAHRFTSCVILDPVDLTVEFNCQKEELGFASLPSSTGGWVKSFLKRRFQTHVLGLETAHWF